MEFKEQRITIRITQGQKEILSKIAKEQGDTLSSYINKLIYSDMDKRGLLLDYLNHSY